jgi:hypothetical protein
MCFRIIKLQKISLLTLCIILVLFVASFLPLWAARHLTYLNDDSYITLAYAKSIANGRGFVFNQPPATLGTTTPLFALIVAAVSKFFPSVEIMKVAVYFSALCWIGIIWALFLCRDSLDINEWQAGIICLIIIASGWLHVKYLGMEVYLFSFLLILSIVLFYRGLFFITGSVLGLLFLTRGEGVLVLLVLIISLIIEAINKKSFNLKTLISAFTLGVGFSLPTLIWFFYAYNTFGSIFPNSMEIKMACKLLGGTPFLSKLIHYWIPLWGGQFTPIPLPFLNLWWVLVIIGIGFAIIKKRKWLVLIAWIACYICGYGILGVGGNFIWYILPIVFVLQIFAALGLIKCIEALNYKRVGVATSMIAIFLAFVVIFTLGKRTVDMVRYSNPMCY